MIKNKGKKLTQKEAWLFLKKEWANVRVVRRDKCYPSVRCEERVPCCGICTCIDALRDRKQITSKTRNAMFKKIDRKSRKQPVSEKERFLGYLFPLSIEGAKQRAKLCGEFAKRCQK
jgi:hypothetical protein